MTPTDIKASIRERHKLGESADVRLLASVITIKADEENDPYKFTARITTDSLDRQDEVVIPAGGDLSEFAASGAIFWNHSYDAPVGFPNKGKKIVRGDNFIDCGGVFMQRPADHQGEFFPDFARAFVTQARAAGINPGVSIGFLPIESRKPTKADLEKYGPTIQIVHSKWKLLEFSIAPVQANQDAVVIAVGKGLMARETAKAVGIEVPDVVTPPAPVVKAPPTIIHETLCVVIPAKKKARIDVQATINKQVHRMLLKEFGQVYV